MAVSQEQLQKEFQQALNRPLIDRHQPPDHFPKSSHLVHTHVWNVLVQMPCRILGTRRLRFRSPAIDFDPKMVLGSRPSIALVIDVNRRRGYRLIATPPAWPGHNVTFCCTVTSLHDVPRPPLPEQLQQPAMYGCINAARTVIPRIPVADRRASNVKLRICAVYRTNEATSLHQLAQLLGSVVPRRTWQHSTLLSSAAVRMYESSTDNRQPFGINAPARNNEPRPVFLAIFLAPPQLDPTCKPWRLMVFRNTQDTDDEAVDEGVADVVHKMGITLMRPRDVQLSGAAVNFRIRSQRQPDTSQMTIRVALDRNHHIRSRSEVMNDDLLRCWERGDQLECELDTVDEWLVSTQPSVLRHDKWGSVAKYVQDMQQLRHDRNGRQMRMRMLGHATRYAPIRYPQSIVHSFVMHRQACVLRQWIDYFRWMELSTMNTHWLLTLGDWYVTSFEAALLTPSDSERVWKNLMGFMYSGELMTFLPMEQMAELLIISHLLGSVSLAACVLQRMAANSSVSELDSDRVRMRALLTEETTYWNARNRLEWPNSPHRIEFEEAEAEVATHANGRRPPRPADADATLQRRCRQMWRLFEPLMGDSITCEWILTLREVPFSLMVHESVLEVRAPMWREYLLEKFRGTERCRSRIFDLDALRLTEASLRRLIGYLYMGDGLQDGDDVFRLICVAKLFGLKELEMEGMDNLLQEETDAMQSARSDQLKRQVRAEVRRMREWQPRTDAEVERMEGERKAWRQREAAGRP